MTSLPLTTMNDPTLRHAGVPYYSQWGSPEWVRHIVEQQGDPCDDPAWRRSGFDDPERYRFWAKRLCGLTCLESALDYWRIGHAPRAEMRGVAALLSKKKFRPRLVAERVPPTLSPAKAKS